MRFSIVLPTRNNVTGLKKMFSSFEETVSNLDNIEVLIAVDKDDEQAEEIFAIQPRFSTKILVTERSKNFSNDYYNRLATLSNGDAIQAFNDDAYYLTKDWDKIIENKVSGRDMWFADIRTTTRFMYPDFPMVSRKSYEALGFLLNPEVRIYPADAKIYEIYKAADLIVDCLDVNIVHEREKMSVEKGDKWHEGWGDICMEDDRAVKNIDINKYARKLKEYESRNNSTASV